MAFPSTAKIWKAEPTGLAMTVTILATALLALSVCCAAEAQTIQDLVSCKDLGGVKGFVHRVLSPLSLSPFQSDGCHLKLKARSGTLQIRAWCIPATAQVLEDHEGRHKCVYHCGEVEDKRDRCIGVGYRLDDDQETRRKELGTLLADFDKVYEGEACLNDFQINALLALDAKRNLDQAADAVKALDNFCCDVMLVFADIVHGSGPEILKGKKFTVFIEKASAKQWEEAAQELEGTEWCSDNHKRCKDDASRIRKGCSASGFWAQK